MNKKQITLNYLRSCFNLFYIKGFSKTTKYSAQRYSGKFRRKFYRVYRWKNLKSSNLPFSPFFTFFFKKFLLSFLVKGLYSYSEKRIMWYSLGWKRTIGEDFFFGIFLIFTKYYWPFILLNIKKSGKPVGIPTLLSLRQRYLFWWYQVLKIMKRVHLYRSFSKLQSVRLLTDYNFLNKQLQYRKQTTMNFRFFRYRR